MAKVAHKLTKDPDLFLGEKVIEVRRVGAPRDVWYKLGKTAKTCADDVFVMCIPLNAVGVIFLWVYIRICTCTHVCSALHNIDNLHICIVRYMYIYIHI